MTLGLGHDDNDFMHNQITNQMSKMLKDLLL